MPLALNVNPADFAVLMASFSSHAAPLANQVRSLVEMDLRKNTIGNIDSLEEATWVLCGSFSWPGVFLL